MKDELVQFQYQDKTSNGKLVVHDRTPKERRNKALATLAKFWGIGIVGIFIPLLHFVIFPIFFVLGIVMSLRIHSIEKTIERGEGTCPVCQAAFRIMPRRYSKSFSDVCDGCHREIKIQAVRA